MALATERATTAWGSTHVYAGAMGTGETMGTTLDDLGIIAEDGISFELEEGDTITLKDINGDTIDELRKQPTLRLTVKLNQPSEAIRNKFWSMTEEGEGNTRKVVVSNLINNDNFSFKMANVDSIGSETFEAPKCKISMDVSWAPDEGYTSTITVTILRAGKTSTSEGKLFQFGKVVASE